MRKAIIGMALMVMAFGFSSSRAQLTPGTTEYTQLLEDIKRIVFQGKDEPRFAYGYAFGAEEERKENLRIIEETMKVHKTSARKEALQAAYDAISVRLSTMSTVGGFVHDKLCGN